MLPGEPRRLLLVLLAFLVWGATKPLSGHRIILLRLLLGASSQYTHYPLNGVITEKNNSA